MHISRMSARLTFLSLFCLFSPLTLAADSSNVLIVENSTVVRAAGETLEDFFTAALRNNPYLKIAQERWEIGKTRKTAATGQLLPQVNASASFSDNRQTQLDRLSTYRGERLSLQLSQVLFNWQAFSQRKQAALVEDMYEAEYYAELARVLTDVAEKYFNVLQAQDALLSSESELEAVVNQAAQVQRLYDLSMVRITDLYDAQARQAAVEAEQQDLASALALAQEALQSASGLVAGNLYQLGTEAELPKLDTNVEQWVASARENNYLIQAREIALQVADERISERRGAYMPSVTLIAQQQRSDLGFDNMPINRTDSGYLGVNVSIPLYAGGRNRAGVREAFSLQNIAISELQVTQMEIGEQTRLAYLRVKSGETRTDSARKLAEATQLSSTARQRGFELGAVTSVDVLNALRDQYLAERDLQRVRYDHIKATLHLRREAGTLTAEDLLEIGALLEAPTF